MSPEILWTAPFFCLLAAIAVGPLACHDWWEENFPLLTFTLASIIVFRYAFILKTPASLIHAVNEYVSFIVLLSALFVVAGGIHIQVKGRATPARNALFLALAGAAANVLGTTGASMVFIRPWMRMNKTRLKAYHVIFFIFIVSNIGGALTPIGDPPLFLGYLRGVPFFWVSGKIFWLWCATMAAILIAFLAFDVSNPLGSPVPALEDLREKAKIEGAHNLLFLAVIVVAVFFNTPRFLREGLMILAAVLSFKTTSAAIRKSNDYHGAPMRDVAILFAGIFITMIPLLEWLDRHAAHLGIQSPGQFFWSSGALSSVLDNAPTYLSFLSAAISRFEAPGAEGSAAVLSLATSHPAVLAAISVGCVFFGAMTYIGNGPNFLVKSIAERSGVKMPGFFGYFFKYSAPVLLPVFFVIWIVCFK